MARSNSTFNVVIKLLAEQFNKGIKDVQRQLRGFGNFVKGAFAIGSITAFGRRMVQTATEFEDAMARVKAVSNASNDQMKMMTDEARKLGATTRYTATEAAAALENLTRNGMSAAEATTALSGVLQLAQANAVGLAEAANIVSNTLNMFGLEAEETARVNDILSATASSTATNITEIYAALVNAAPAAKVLGFTLEETTAAVGALAQRGVKAEQAGTALRMAFTKMVDPKIVAKMQEMGVAIDEQSMKAEGLLPTLKKLKDAQLSLADLVSIFSQRGAVGIQQLIGAYDELELELEIVKNSSGTTARMFTEGVGTTRAAIDTLKSTYESFLISLGNKTSGAVNGVIGFLTKLIKNFDTLGGTLVNIAAVTVPLFTSKAVSMFTTFSVGARKATKDALALKVAMGDWITLAATAVTWIGTYLYTSMSKVNQEIKKYNSELSQNEVKTAEMRTAVSNLLSRLGPKTDSKTLASVISELTGMFPDFKTAIHDAGVEAGKTKNYEHLRGVMEDILSLQNAIAANNILQGLADAYVQDIAENLKQVIKRTPAPGMITGFITEERAELALLKDEIERKAGSNQGLTNKIYETIARTLGNSNSVNQATRNLKRVFDMLGLSLNDETILRIAQNHINSQSVQKLRSTNDLIQENAKIQTSTKANLQAAEDDAAQRAADEEDRKNRQKDLNEKIIEVDKTFNNTTEYLLDDYNNSLKSAAEYNELYAQAVKTAYEDLRKLTGKTGKDNKYFDEYKRTVDMKNRRKEDKEFLDQLKSINKNDKDKNSLTGKATVDNPTGLASKSNLPDVSIGPYVPDFDDFVEGAENAMQITGSFVNSLNSLSNAFDTLKDSESNWLEKLNAIVSIMQSCTSVFKTMGTVIDALGDMEIFAAKKEEAATNVRLINAKKKVAANTAEAVSGAAASQAGIPGVGPFLVPDAIAAVLAAIAASLPAFANGGIIQGNSKTGDKLLARVNAGEIILNQTQQRRLFNLANGNGAVGGQVEFVIDGKQLKGVLRNYDRANAKIAGRL